MGPTRGKSAKRANLAKARLVKFGLLPKPSPTDRDTRGRGKKKCTTTAANSPKGEKALCWKRNCQISRADIPQSSPVQVELEQEEEANHDNQKFETEDDCKVEVKEEADDFYSDDGGGDHDECSNNFNKFQVEEQNTEFNMEIIASPFLTGGTTEEPSKTNNVATLFPCLLCFKYTACDLSWLDNCSEKDFMVMFILKKMLQVPSEHLQRYLGGLESPKEMIHICQHCTPVVTEAFAVQQKINTLEKELREYQKKMKISIKATYCPNKKRKVPDDTSPVSKKTYGKMLRLTEETRYFVTMDGVWPTGLMKPLNVRKKSAAVAMNAPKCQSSPSPKSLQRLAHTDDGAGSGDDDDNFHHGCDYDEDEDQKSLPGSPLRPNDVSPIKVKTEYCPPDTQQAIMTLLPSESQYNCELCPNLRIKGCQSFVEHILFHYERPYKCSICDRFLTGSQLELDNFLLVHNHNKEGVGANHRCSMDDLVKVVFKTGKIWDCAHCSEMFHSEIERDTHEGEVHADKPAIDLPFSCAGCPKKFRDVDDSWRLHRVLEHGHLAKFACFYCNEIFKLVTKDGHDILDEKSLREHVTAKHQTGEGKYYRSSRYDQCDVCGANFSLTTQLIDHFKNFHVVDRNSNLFPCRLCFKRYRTKNTIPKHIKQIHLQIRQDYVCELCGYKTYEPLPFVEHKFLVHAIEPEDGRKMYNCTKKNCSFRSMRKIGLDRHMMKEHNMERRWKCKFCGKGFLSSSHLGGHERIHINATNKPYQCELCGNSFAVRNYLYIHMRLSHQNRPFASTNKKRPSKKSKMPNISTSPMKKTLPMPVAPPMECTLPGISVLSTKEATSTTAQYQNNVHPNWPAC